MVGKSKAGKPVRGGTLTFAAYSEPTVLDPTRTLGQGPTGGAAMAAVYDVLMRWNPTTRKVEPQLAKSLAHNGDYTKWTLQLRQDVTFSDGTPLNARAVTWSIHRYVTKGGALGSIWDSNVEQMIISDAHTVVFQLRRKWPGFPYLLSTAPGMIVAHSAVQGDHFTPIGAGPFVFDHHASQEELVLTANQNYWGGKPYLDKVRFVFLNSGRTKLDSLKSGSIQAAFLRNPEIVTDAMKAGFGGFKSSVSLGSVALINAGKGRPGHDPRVRKALFQAIDPKVIFQRAYHGAGNGSNAVFPPFSRWHTDVKPLPYNPDAARKLLDGAKADGYDGKITYTDGQDPTSRATAVAVKSMLEKVGFQVKLDLVRSVADLITKVEIHKDYDLTGWGLSWREAGTYTRMYATQNVHGQQSYGIYTSEPMSRLVEQFQSADTPAEKRKVAGKIQTQWNRDIPALIFGASPNFVAISNTLHGVNGTSAAVVLLAHAWLEKTR